MVIDKPAFKQQLNERLNVGVNINFDYYSDSVDIFNRNLKYIIKQAGLKQKEFLDLINTSDYITINYDRINQPTRTRRGNLTFLYLCTLSRILGYSVHDMLNPNLPTLIETGEVKPI